MLYSSWVLCNLSASKSEPQCIILLLFCVVLLFLPLFFLTFPTLVCVLCPFLSLPADHSLPSHALSGLHFYSHHCCMSSCHIRFKLVAWLTYKMVLWFSYILSGKFLKIIFLNCCNIISKYNNWRSWNEILGHILGLIFSCSIKVILTAGLGHHFKSKLDFMLFGYNIIHKSILYMPIFLIFVDSF